MANTSWNKVARWYDELLGENKDTYQRTVILPNLLRLMELKKGDAVLDLGCGQGFFSERFQKLGARVIGVDIAPKLIALAKKRAPGIDFRVQSADQLDSVKDQSMDIIVSVLALQNIEYIAKVFSECARVLKPRGKIYLVLNHPAFRIPHGSEWGWDEKAKAQYRRVDRYLSESRIKIQMHPGQNPGVFTTSFHRPLQVYFKTLHKNGFSVSRLEEWISHKKSQPGPRAAAEDTARKEIPLFLVLEVIRV